jgi:hypothetical protein
VLEPTSYMPSKNFMASEILMADLTYESWHCTDPRQVGSGD